MNSVDINVKGDRVRAARLEAGLTQEQLSSALGLARTTLVAIERNQRAIRNDEIERLASVLNISVGRLIAEDTLFVEFRPQYRRYASQSDEAHGIEALSLLSRLASGAAELERVLGSEMRFDYPTPIKFSPHRYRQQAEDAALMLRQRFGWGVGRVNDLFATLELDLGIRIFVRDLPGSISGLYGYDPSVGACILINARQERRRRNMTLAHEVGHFIVNRQEADVFDESASTISVEERFARFFAPCLLMPSPGIRSRVESLKSEERDLNIEELVFLAYQYDVTSEAMCRRLEDLRIVASGTWKMLLDMGYNKDLEYSVLSEVRQESETAVPLVGSRHAFLAARAIKEGLLSSSQICELLMLDRVELADIIAPFQS